MNINSSFNFELGGTPRTLKIDMNMLCEVEELLNERLMQNEEFWGDMSFIKLRGLAWAMLYAETPRPSVITVGDWLSKVSLEEFTAAFMETFTKDFAKEDTPSAAGKKKKVADPTKG